MNTTTHPSDRLTCYEVWADSHTHLFDVWFATKIEFEAFRAIMPTPYLYEVSVCGIVTPE